MSILDKIGTQFSGGSVRARALRGTLATVSRVGLTNVLRLVSSLILTRILFPEAFGLMAIIQMFLYGLQTFSDVGIRTMLIQHERGSEQGFLDVLWTMQILRGVVLWLAACAISFPAAAIYDQEILTILLPVVAFTLVISGFTPTREPVANRELKLERVVMLQLSVQVIELLITVALSYALQSVWGLAIGLLAGSVLRVLFFGWFLPGSRDKLAWDRDVVIETLKFGSWIFLSTIATFFVNIGNRLVLGAYVDLATFGIFNIAIMLATNVGLITAQVGRTVIFPLYRLKPPRESKQNQANLFKARRMVAGLQMGFGFILAVLGIWIVEFLYDDRYILAGPMVVMIAIRFLPGALIVGTQEALIGSGDSKSYFLLLATVACVNMALLVVFVPIYGIVAAIVIPLIANLITYPYRAWLIRRHDAWDPVGELGVFFAGLTVASVLLWFQWDGLQVLF